MLIRSFSLCGLLGIWAIVILFFVVFSPTVVAYQTYADCQIALSKQSLRSKACKNHQVVSYQSQQLDDTNSITAIGLMLVNVHTLFKEVSVQECGRDPFFWTDYGYNLGINWVSKRYENIKTSPVLVMLSVHAVDTLLPSYEEVFKANNDTAGQSRENMMSSAIKGRLVESKIYNLLMSKLKRKYGESLSETFAVCEDQSYVMIFCPYRADKPELSLKQLFRYYFLDVPTWISSRHEFFLRGFFY